MNQTIQYGVNQILPSCKNGKRFSLAINQIRNIEVFNKQNRENQMGKTTNARRPTTKQHTARPPKRTSTKAKGSTNRIHTSTTTSDMYSCNRQR